MLQIDFLSLTVFDLEIISIIAISVVFGLLRGLIKSTVSFVGWAISFVLAARFSESFIPLFEKYAGNSDMANVISAAVLFLFFAIIIAILNSIIITVVSIICGGIIDRSLGLFFGFVRGCFLVSFAFYFMTIMWPSLDVKDRSDVYEDNYKLPKWAKNSESLLLLARGSNFISQYMPEKLEKGLQRSLEESKDRQGKITFSSSKSDNIKSINKLLGALPEDFLDEIDGKDILTLQDTDVSHKEKVAVLEEVATRYEKYHSKKIYYGASKDEIQKHNQEHHKIMQMLEREIKHYNSLIADE
jgi:membrane protein required for colicin V production